MTLRHEPDWVLCHDGDELYEDSAPQRIFEAIRSCPDDVAVLDVQFLYMWDDLQHYRCDGIYERIFHHRLFRLKGQQETALSFESTAHGANFHCESVPPNIKGRVMQIDVVVKHLGYMHKEDRLRKYRWYKKMDPQNAVQGYYEHLLDQPGMRIEQWQERPFGGGVKKSADVDIEVHDAKQERKPDYYYANARRNIVNLVPHDAKRVLDVGCGMGMTGGLLKKERQIEVVGLEMHSGVAETARAHLSDVICGDVESMDIPFAEKYFDCIILADVLEHLVDPWGTLKRLVRYLGEDGLVISSIPNIRNLGILEKLAKGAWDYQEQGILDKTHLRFFALKNMVAMFEEAGIDARVAEVVRDPVFVNQMAEIDSQRAVDVTYGPIVLKAVSAEDYDELTAQQFILTGRRSDSRLAYDENGMVRQSPAVSVVIPVFNHLDFTRQCLESLFKINEKLDFEIIVVDDASTDDTVAELEKFENRIRIVQNSHNSGFAKSCNAGARKARGKYVVFLNNDTVVLPGWLTSMKQCFEKDPAIGLVGNLQLYPDNRFVQQAGIVCGADHMLYSIYNNQLPGSHPAVNKPREFQFVAGSCMMIEKDFFFELGGFDEAYLNSCEDVDLCLKVRQAGRKVFYCPQSQILHYESKSVKGHDKSGGNYQLFLQRWRDILIQDDVHYLEQDGMLDNSPKRIPAKKPVTVLIAPPRYFKNPEVSIYSGYSKNLGLGYIAATLKQAGYEVLIIDAFALGIDQFEPEMMPNGRVFRCGLKIDQIAELIPARTAFIGIGIPFSNVAPIGFDLAVQLKSKYPRAQVILGGIHPSTFPEDSLRPGVDFVIAGEGERSMLALVSGQAPESIPGLFWKDPDGTICRSERVEYIKHLDDLPFPAWELLPMEKYMTISPRGNRQHRSLSVITSRGCPFSCKFCSVHPVAGSVWRARSAENVLSEIRRAVAEYHIDHIEIEDDNFTIDKQRSLKILKGLHEIDPKLTWSAHNGLRIDTLDKELLIAIKDSGCTRLNLAIEHGSPAVLKAMNKRLSLEKVRQVIETCGRIGLKTHGFCLVGFPSEDHHAFSESFKFYQTLMQSGLSEVVPFIVNAYPGTELYEEALQNNWLRSGADTQLFFLEDEYVSVLTDDFDTKMVRKRKAAMEFLNRDPGLDADRLLKMLAPSEKDGPLKAELKYCVNVLQDEKEITAARSELRDRGISFAEPTNTAAGMQPSAEFRTGDVKKSWDVLKTVNFIEETVPRTGKVLDLGAFCSEMLPILDKLGYQNLHGIDLNPDVARMPHADRISYSVCNFHQTAYPDETFDAITAISVIEHGFDGSKLLSEISRLLKPGGHFVASIDYWPQKLDTSGLQAFGMDWLIFSEEELDHFLAEAERYGMFAHGPRNLRTGEATVNWNNRRYTFAWLVLKKKSAARDTGHPDLLSPRRNAEKIAYLTTYNQPCGIATHTEFVLDGLQGALSRFNGSAAEIIILAEDGVEKHAPDNPNVFRCWKRDNENFEDALSVIERERVSVVHIQFQAGLFYKTDIADFARQCRERSVRVYATFHSSESQLPLCVQLIGELDKAFVHLEQSAVRFIAYGADPKKIEVIPHGILPDRATLSLNEAKQQVKISAGGSLISSFGFFEPHKGVDGILRALPTIFEKHPNSLFAFLGGCNQNSQQSIDYFNHCRGLARQLGINDKVMFAEGFISEEMASLYLLASDVVVLNYTREINEISGAASFALAHCRPVVTSSAPAFKPLANCTLQLSLDMDIARAVHLILATPGLSSYLVDQSRMFIRQNSFEVLGGILLNAYGILPYN
jgi:GT2 family glycosyltransferase/radical SAM superfamily enzyme YgiQ (UPF0313 family)/2-polyprenyl-3-methyl-5-hydroxy-6-metoxy-1,4-benzoquinol methylase/glycosyltransferase involved in cell wall biosynthesis